ncbi:signal recognition particle-docking protein FtsY [Rhodobacteraceae bacterium RKSG542]|uniref:signal recognition particle-docking protein FtsY n=1 Tax=Pseudovibrio flavus TaxID=2529854 RepID=UPI0012BD30AE|nr:signal recognition particle-docking protein FtsY [Pseudovibrio flavus]MTI17874.1 signal recognition particle-docking protein FtsY [Pseudovibrio flavus]
MSEKKRGFFSRLFGSREETPENNETVAPVAAEEVEQVVEAAEEALPATPETSEELPVVEPSAPSGELLEPFAAPDLVEPTPIATPEPDFGAVEEPAAEAEVAEPAEVEAPVAEEVVEEEVDQPTEELQEAIDDAALEAVEAAEPELESADFDKAEESTNPDPIQKAGQDGDVGVFEEPRETEGAGEAQRVREPEGAEAPQEAEPIKEIENSQEVSRPLEEEIVVAPVPVEPQPAKQSWFQRLKQGLFRSSSALSEGITSIFTKRKLDAETLEELEDILIQADLGVDTAMNITEKVSEGRYNKEISGEEVKQILAEEVERVLEPVALPLNLDSGHKPHIVLMVGVNGTGKTTTIGKLSSLLAAQGKKVMLAAGDTFRAAAVEQLKVWGQRTGAEVIARDTGADAAGLAYDAVQQAIEKNVDVLLIDTAGRLQNKTLLMDELEKIVRVIKKQVPDAPHTTLLTLDATTGQNALSQVEIFGKVAGVNGLVMTKLDGTARGGILVAIAAKYGLPVHFIGVGEGMEDLEPFSAKDFAAAIAGMDFSEKN